MSLSPWIKSIKIHQPDEGHRQASWLELFVDLGFVVAISSLTSILEEGLSLTRLVTYLVVFFAVFWLWNRFTWYATYYDNGDVLFRISYLLIVFPILGIVANIDNILAHEYAAATGWYIALDTVLLWLWGRVWYQATSFKANARSFFLSYLIGLLLVVASLWIPGWGKYLCWGGAFLVEMIGPIIGWEQPEGELPVHTGHVVERHGLFTIILLGEGVVSVSYNFKHLSGMMTGGWLLLAYLSVVALWWIYFDHGYGFATQLSKNLRNTFILGYGQFLVFSSVALITISLEFGLHHHLAVTDHSTNVPSHFSELLLYSQGTFLIILSSVQWLISDRNPTNIYWTRCLAGGALIVLNFLAGPFSFATALIIGTVMLVGVSINDSYGWGMVRKREA